jgi:hypothetical protein
MPSQWATEANATDVHWMFLCMCWQFAEFDETHQWRCHRTVFKFSIVRWGPRVGSNDFCSFPEWPGAKLLAAAPDQSQILEPPEEAQQALAKVGQGLWVELDRYWRPLPYWLQSATNHRKVLGFIVSEKLSQRLGTTCCKILGILWAPVSLRCIFAICPMLFYEDFAANRLSKKHVGYCICMQPVSWRNPVQSWLHFVVRAS